MIVHIWECTCVCLSVLEASNEQLILSKRLQSRNSHSMYMWMSDVQYSGTDMCKLKGCENNICYISQTTKLIVLSNLICAYLQIPTSEWFEGFKRGMNQHTFVCAPLPFPSYYLPSLAVFWQRLGRSCSNGVLYVHILSNMSGYFSTLVIFIAF